jgi:acetyl esterase/lipase
MNASGRSAVPRTYRYADGGPQVCDLYLPGVPPRGVVVLVHGGYWRARYDRTLQEPVARDLWTRGWAVWNIDYRGVGEGENGGGGWPRTYQDVAAAADLLVPAAADAGLDLAALAAARRPCAVVGHSAGGAMALWLAGRRTPGALRLDAVVAQGAVCDLRVAARRRFGDGAVLDLMGGAGPDEAPDAYAAADPSARLPLGAAILLVTGDRDEAVPYEQSVTFARLAGEAGDDVRLEVVAGDGHFGHLDPEAPAYLVARDWLEALHA